VKSIQSALIICFLAVVAMFPSASRAQKPSNSREGSKVGIGVKISSLGAGIEVGVPVAGKLNLRGGFNAISYGPTFNKDGVHYAGNISWRSGEANLDWFPFGGFFHVSPGLLVYNGNKITATAMVPAGQNFTLNNQTYQSQNGNPISGTGKLDFGTKVDPAIRVGIGNLIPRSGRHWSILAEAGVAYQGSPRAALTFQGGACDTTQSNCLNAATDPTVQANVQAEQNKINHDVSFFKFYPIVSVGVGYNF